MASGSRETHHSLEGPLAARGAPGQAPREGSPASLQQLRKQWDEEQAEFRDPAGPGQLRLEEQREARMPHHEALMSPCSARHSSQ